MGSESDHEKLKNLEIVAAIANKLDGDLKQLKLWIKTQFDSVSFNESPSPAPFSNRNVTPGPSNYTPNYSLRSENRHITETRGEFILGDCTFSRVPFNVPDVSPADDSLVDVIVSDEDIDPLDPLNHVKNELPERIVRQSPRFTPNSNQSQLCITNGESSGTSAAVTSSANSAPNNVRVTPKNCPFVCKICRKRFTTKFSLDKHRDLHQRGWRWNCSKCKRKFKTNEDLKNHTSIYHWEAGIKVKKVSSVKETPKKSNVRPENPTPSTAQVSLKRKQASTMLQSKNTSKSSFKKLPTPRKSIPGTSNSTPNSNGVRKRPYFKSKTLNILKPETKTDYKCGECFKIFQDLPQLKLHEKTHINSMVFKCPIPSCKEAFSSKDDLRLHKSVHGIKIRHKSTRIPGVKITCRICGGKYINTSIQGHLENIHLACGSVKCERSFEDMQTLWSHKRIHHPRKVKATE